MLTMGIDIGSAACKCVIMESGKTIVARAVVQLGTGTIGPRQVYNDAMAQIQVDRRSIKRILVTGYGRFTFDDTDSQKSELSCHAKGVGMLIPSARTIIDIGGQDIKVLKVKGKGILENFVMNDKCAAGTGKFLDVMAGVINVKTKDLGHISELATEEVNISNTCTVFAESEVISKLSTNVKIENLVAGIHRSVAKRVAIIAYRNGIVKDVAMSGGVALNQGVVKALSEELQTEILVHADCQFAGAIGAAIFAREELSKNT